MVGCCLRPQQPRKPPCRLPSTDEVAGLLKGSSLRTHSLESGLTATLSGLCRPMITMEVCKEGCLLQERCSARTIPAYCVDMTCTAPPNNALL